MRTEIERVRLHRRRAGYYETDDGHTVREIRQDDGWWWIYEIDGRADLSGQDLYWTKREAKDALERTLAEECDR